MDHLSRTVSHPLTPAGHQHGLDANSFVSFKPATSAEGVTDIGNDNDRSVDGRSTNNGATSSANATNDPQTPNAAQDEVVRLSPEAQAAAFRLAVEQWRAKYMEWYSSAKPDCTLEYRMDQIIGPLIEVLAEYWLDFSKTRKILISIAPEMVQEDTAFDELSGSLIESLIGNTTSKTIKQVTNAQGLYYQAWNTEQERRKWLDYYGNEAERAKEVAAESLAGSAGADSRPKHPHWNKVKSIFR